MVLLLLGPANQDRPVAVEPGVTGLDHPAARSPIGVALLEVDLLTAGADVGREAVVTQEVADPLVVIGLVEAEALGIVFGGFGTLDRDRVERSLQQLVVVAVGAIVIDSDRDPRSLCEERALRPPLALSVGLGPVLGPPSGAFVIAPSAASQDQSMPTSES